MLFRSGLEALRLILYSKKIDPARLQTRQKVLEEARKPVAECELAVLPGVELLFNSLKK